MTTASRTNENHLNWQFKKLKVKFEDKRFQKKGPITIKDIPLDELLATFQDHEKKLLDIFNQRRNRLDHFNNGNGFDYNSRELNTSIENIFF